jgi:hypothetical protein
VIIDDHLLRDVLVGERSPDLGGLAPEGVATTGLWLFRLCSSFADPAVIGKLSAPVAGLPAELQAAFRGQLVSLPAQIGVLSMRDLAWSMAELQAHHRGAGRALSAAMVEALAAAHELDVGIAVARHDVGPNLRAAAESDGIAFHVV